MIDRFTKQDLFRLVQKQNDPCVTIYLPTQKTGREIYEPTARLKKLIESARHKLAGHWMSDSDATKFLKPISELANNKDFWQKADQGLAIFLNANSLTHWRVEQSFPEQTYVSHQFFVKPMLMATGNAEPFNILAISKNKSGLFEVCGSTIEAVDVPELPTSMEDALKLTSVDRGGQVHTGSREFGGKEASVFHGQGVKPESEKTDLKQYFRHVNTAVAGHLKDKSRPLVLACVASHVPIYRDVNTYPDLLDEVATGNFDRQSSSTLLEKALPISKKHFNGLKQTAIKSYLDMANTTQTVSETSAVVAAAHTGRIDKLLVCESTSLPGEFDMSNQTINYESSSDRDLDLIEDSIAQTLLHRGEVFALKEDEMPDQHPMVATLRF